MIIGIYSPPGAGQHWGDCKKGDINDAISWQYDKFFCGVGTFEMVIPVTSIFGGVLEINDILKVGDDALMIKNIKNDEKEIKITGYDLNCFLLDRITLYGETQYAGTDGYDVAEGTTDYCVKYYIDRNMINAEDANRIVPRLSVAAVTGIGVAADSYMARLETLEDVVRTMCEGAGIGYRIKADWDCTADGAAFIFDVYSKVDKTAEQYVNNRVIFSVPLKNVKAIAREVGITAEKNTFTVETAGGIQPTIHKDAENAAVGLSRREQYMSISCPDEEADTVQLYAGKEIADKYAETDSLTVDAGNPLEYGVLYDVGDIATVYDKKKTVQLDSVISEVLIKKSASEYTVKITLGESKPKLLDGYAKKNSVFEKFNKQNPPKDVVGAQLTEYTVTDNTTITYNGRTYTFDKSDAGIITRVTRSDGAVFSPDISADITNIAEHNAAFMAIAMFSSMAARVYGNENILDDEYISGGYWQNRGNGYDVDISGCTIDGGVAGYITIPITGNVGDYTAIMVMKSNSALDNAWNSVFANIGSTPQFNICTYLKYWAVGSGSTVGYYRSSINAGTLAVLAVRKSNRLGEFYINGTKYNSYNGYYTPISGYWDSVIGITKRYIHTVPRAMTDAELTAEIASLKTKYGIT